MITNLKIFALLTVITGCGNIPAGSVAGTDSSTSTATTEAAATTQPDVNVTAKYYLAKSDLPICDDTLARELVYVKETSTFEYCDAANGWTVVDLKGAKGDAGAQGVAGAAGKDGANGKDGSNGKDGETTARAQVQSSDNISSQMDLPASADVWVHPINGKHWFVGAQIDDIKDGPNSTDNNNLKDSVYFCPAGSRLPVGNEYSDAIRAGLWNFFVGLYPDLKGFSLGTGDFKEHYYGDGGLITYNMYYSLIGKSNGNVYHAGNFPLHTLCVISN